MSPFHTHSLILPDPSNPARPRHMAYYEWGDAANPQVVVCVHGLSRNGRDFDVLAQRLSANYRVICPDIAGRGKSAWLENKADYCYPTYVADMNSLLAELKLSQVTWIGTSMGGIIGMMIAAGQTGIIKQLVLNDVGSVVSAEGLKRIAGYVGVSPHFADKAAALERLKLLLKPFGIRTEMQMEHMFAISFTPLPDGSFTFAYDPAIGEPFRQAAAKGEEIKDVDLSLFWDKVNCPTLVLRGEDSDILSKATAEGMCKRPATDHVEFEGTGHAPALMEEYQVGTIAVWINAKCV